MPQKTYSAQHEFVASALAREFRAYFAHTDELDELFKKRAARGNSPFHTFLQQEATQHLRLKIIILEAVYVEALVNLYLSLKLGADQFAAIDRVDLVQKWTAIPSMMVPKYTLPKSGALYGDLKALVSQRNAIVHMKPRIADGDKIVHAGSFAKKIPIHRQIVRWATLPRGLMENIGKADSSNEFFEFQIMSSISTFENVLQKG
jgi:hypothetical protein